MTCRCGAQWCYLCKGDWKNHSSATGGNFKCKIFEEAQKKSHLDWEGYTEEERARFLDQKKTERAQRYEIIVAKVKLQEEAMDLSARKLSVARKIVSSPYLLYRMHGVRAPEGTPEPPVDEFGLATAASTRASTESAAAPGRQSIADLRASIASVIAARQRPGGQLQVAQRRRVSDASSLSDVSDSEDDDAGSSGSNASEHVPSSLWRQHAADKQRFGRGSASAAPARASWAPALPVPISGTLPAPDERVKYEIAQERRRLETIVTAFEALLEFHRVEKWCFVHLFYTDDPDKAGLLSFKQMTLETHASDLFDMLNGPVTAVAAFDEPRIRSKLQAVNRFCRNLLQEVDYEHALAGRVDADVLAGVSVSIGSPSPGVRRGAASGAAGVQ